MLNATLQVAGALGVAVIGMIFFGLLGAAGPRGQVFSVAAEQSLWFEVGLFMLSFLLVFLLPKEQSTDRTEWQH